MFATWESHKQRMKVGVIGKTHLFFVGLPRHPDT